MLIILLYSLSSTMMRTTMMRTTMSRNTRITSTTARLLQLSQQQIKLQDKQVHHRTSWRLTQFSSFSSSTSDTTGATAAADESPVAVQWKRIIKPFLVKCHPDMAKQQGLSNAARQVNLRAIQNLNSYVNGVIAMQGTTKYPFDVNQRMLEIDFVLALPQKDVSHVDHKKYNNKGAQHNPTTSRRTIELKVPPPHASPGDLKRMVSRELLKLLNMAGLHASSSSLLMSYEDDEQEYEDGYEFDEHHANRNNNNDNTSEEDDFWMSQGVDPGSRRRRRRPKTAWERSRDAFTANIDWKKFDAAYNEAVNDMHADFATQGMIRDNPARRRALLASILQRVQVKQLEVEPLERNATTNFATENYNDENPSSSSSSVSSISFLDKLVTLRRLFQILEDHFDRLQLETCGRFWEQVVQIQLVGPRAYNTSTSALHRRRQRKLDTGFGYTLHQDNAVTITIPVDFQEDELVEELDRNVWDFYNMMQQQEYQKMGLGWSSGGGMMF